MESWGKKKMNGGCVRKISEVTKRELTFVGRPAGGIKL